MGNDVFVDGLTAGASIVGGVGVLLTIGRLFVQRGNKHPAARGASYFNAAAALLLIAFLAVQCHNLPLYDASALWSKRKGPVVSGSNLDLFYRVEMAVAFLFWTVMYLAKFSLLMLYRSLFDVSKQFRAAWWGVSALTLIAFLMDFLGVMWVCGSPANLSGPSSACATKANALAALNMIVMGVVVNVVSDLAIMALPLGMLPRLQLGLGKKLGLAMIFLLAWITIAFDIMRVVFTFTLSNGLSIIFDTVEPALAVVVCTLPVYGRTCAHAWQWLRSRVSSKAFSTGNKGEAVGGGPAPLPLWKLRTVGSERSGDDSESGSERVSAERGNTLAGLERDGGKQGH